MGQVHYTDSSLILTNVCTIITGFEITVSRLKEVYLAHGHFYILLLINNPINRWN